VIPASVTVVFTRRRALGSAALRALLWSRWSHCGIVVPGGTVIEAGVHGVVERALDDMIAQCDQYELVTIPCPAPAAVIAAARAQLGKPYDWIGLAGFGLRRSAWQNDARWFCSELVAHAFAVAGYPLLRSEPWRVSPPMLYLPIFDARGRCDCDRLIHSRSGVPSGAAHASIAAMDAPEDNARQFQNLIQRGTVADLDLQAARCRVDIGEVRTDWLPWFTPCAGETLEWSPPSLGEAVLVFGPGGALEGGLVQRGFFSDRFPAPSASPDVWMRTFPDGTVLEYNHAAHRLTGTLAGGGKVELHADGGFEFTGPFKVNGDSQFNGDVGVSKTLTAQTDVIGGGKSLKGHKHLGVQTGSSVSGAPQ